MRDGCRTKSGVMRSEEKNGMRITLSGDEEKEKGRGNQEGAKEEGFI